MNHAIDLTQEPPRSARIRLRGYAILARTIDKCLASIDGHLGEYHFDCPLDNMLFSFKNINAEDFKKTVLNADADDDVALWVDQAGTHRTEGEIAEWSDSVEGNHPYASEEKREWFVGECTPLGLDPESSTLFDYLDADDKAFVKK